MPQPKSCSWYIYAPNSGQNTWEFYYPPVSYTEQFWMQGDPTVQCAHCALVTDVSLMTCWTWEDLASLENYNSTCSEKQNLQRLLNKGTRELVTLKLKQRWEFPPSPSLIWHFPIFKQTKVLRENLKFFLRFFSPQPFFKFEFWSQVLLASLNLAHLIPLFVLNG